MPDPHSRPLRHAALVLALAALAACGSAGASDDQPSGTIGGVGLLPDQEATSAVPSTSAPEGTAATTTLAPGQQPTGAPDVVAATSSTLVPIAERVTGNKLLMVGDSIFAGTASRYGNEACSTLVPLNWQVDVEAESGRAIDFGERIVRQMAPQGWDVIVFFLGTNYGGNEVGYRQYLVKALDEIPADTPVVILTTTLYATKQEEVNTIIREEAATRPNVAVLDWATLSKGPGLLSADGYHPSPEGRQVMMTAISYLVGQAPVAPGKCLQSKNRSDVPNTPGAPTTAPKGGGGGSGTTTTKAPATTPATNTTVPATTATTRPPTTNPPPNTLVPPTAASTQPPVTQPPATQPPVTTQAPATTQPPPPDPPTTPPLPTVGP